MTAPLKASKKKLYVGPPRTAMQIYELLPEGTHCEVIGDVIYMLPDRLVDHQDVSGKILTDIYTFLFANKIGKCVTGPLSIYFDESNVVQPDIIFICNENMGIVKEGKVKGVPDMLAEILSPGNRSHDLKRKFDLYESFKVPEYFIIDPLTKDVLHYLLKENKYQKQPATKGKIDSKILNESFSF